MGRKDDNQSDEEKRLRADVEKTVTQGDVDWNSDDDDDNEK